MKICVYLKLQAYVMLHLQKIRLYSHRCFAASLVLRRRPPEVPTQHLFAFSLNIIP
jgi:hypothetical protein